MLDFMVVREGLEHFCEALDIDEFIVWTLEELSPKCSPPLIHIPSPTLAFGCIRSITPQRVWPTRQCIPSRVILESPIPWAWSKGIVGAGRRAPSAERPATSIGMPTGVAPYEKVPELLADSSITFVFGHFCEK